MNSKIAIVTHYYQSYNFGGNLQAYALCSVIHKISDYNPEQLCYPFESDNFPVTSSLTKVDKLKQLLKSSKFIINLVKLVFNKLYYLCKDFYLSYLRKKYESVSNMIAEKRKKSFYHFNSMVVPHSNTIYTSKNIYDSLKYYNIFITGSDQVWNTTWRRPIFFLDFVPSDKIKISYAASISKDSLTDKEKEIFKKSLADFKAVSVREEQAVDLIKDLSPVKPVVTLDPTLLLDASDWDKVCAPRVVEDDYIFCYFLGDNPKERKIAKKFAKEKGLKLVSVPLTGVKVYSDLKFGDVILPAASPEEFISLIKHASYVFTDSFHAVVFSQIYQRQYFVFNRDVKGSMNSRIINITNLFNTQERFCNGKEKETLQYVMSLEDIDFSRPNPKFDEIKEFSINFLKENLK